MTCDELTQQCDLLSKEIEQTRKDNEWIVFDGVIDPACYTNAKTKILWILKEANDPDGEEDWSYINNFKRDEWLNEKKCAAIPSIKRVMYASYGILYGADRKWGDFPWYSDRECQKALKEIAFINIKKTPGGSCSDDWVIRQAYVQNRELLLKQIRTYNPDVILFGGTLKYFNKEKDFDDLDKSALKISDFNNHYYYGENRLYIYAYHPACRGAGFTDSGYVMDIVKIVKTWKNRF